MSYNLASMISENADGSAMNRAMFRRRLLEWFHRHQRKLPWRGERDPFRILVSEIMLQQTRVAVVEERYKKFIAQFPTAKKLAGASEQTVLAAWSGLGYYRRARNLRAAAKEIAGHNGFPRSAAKLRELPGIGRYTANAVASIAFGEPVAVVDGNVKRVLERVFAAEFLSLRNRGEERYWQLAAALLDESNPGDFNQAMMELGATVCLPGQPLCAKCPVAKMCAANGPIASRARPRRRKAVQRYALVRRQGRVLLQRRPRGSSLMPGMWELPLIDADAAVEGKPVLKLRHSITTTDYKVFVHRAASHKTTRARWLTLRSAKRLPLTGLTRKILEGLGDA
jgi:A/G-specific adenine glycosylase